ncbi:MAG: aldehyde dehydrogenase family protein [Phycisphaerae bacterium]|jgi:aldehyde dehydrogenase (NAD+)|nr:aldehyde dehydrogenase family protein [Phycisphaerae bacterium]
MTTKAQELSGWEYSLAPETTKIDIEQKNKLFIQGKFVSPKSRSWFSTINPATEEKLADVACAGKADVESAVTAAKKALPKWSRLSGSQRAKYLYRIARRIQERSRELAILETMDGGKPIKESRDVDLPLVAQHFFYYAGWADKMQYAFPGANIEPVGVCAQIIPWNFPLMMAAWKLAPALACGNTCILKPAETTSLTALRLAEIMQEVGLPEGVVNILTGAGETGKLLAEHKSVNKVAFTGSTAVGKSLMRSTAGTGKKLTLELGGKSANIIFADAAIDQAVEGIVSGIYFNQGHVCCAGSRLFVEEPILDEVVSKLTHRLRSLRVGNPLDKNTDLGAINSQEQLDTVERYIRNGTEEGAQLHEIHSERLPSKGYWCSPCFFTDVQPSHTIAREEIFGPVLSVMTFRTPQEAISRANNSPYGLAAGIWTNKGSKIFEVAKKLDAGVVWCNTYNKFDAASPFGGFKESGFGREGGMQGLRPYVRLQNQSRRAK